MIPPINGASGIRQIDSIISQPTAKPSSTNFGNVLESVIDKVELSRSNAQESVQRFVTGEEDELHSTILSVQRAEMDFELALQVKNKVVQAYQEIMRMQI
jgi:flagellar hook-basal body complex protein FliE